MTTPCAQKPLPEYDALTGDQARGRACVACGKPLTTDAVYRGVVLGRAGAYVLDADVWSCPTPEAGQ